MITLMICVYLAIGFLMLILSGVHGSDGDEFDPKMLLIIPFWLPIMVWELIGNFWI